MSDKNILKPFFLKKSENSSDDRPYILFNKNISEKYIWLSQKARSLEEALYICSVWFMEGYNCGTTNMKESVGIPFNLYFYNSKQEITKKEMNGGSDYINVLVYKKNDVLCYISLLKFGERSEERSLNDLLY
jgi:hypothetical protein